MRIPEGHLKLSELARRARVGRGTIQHYLREGLLPRPLKTHHNMAYYDPSCVERIALIKRLRQTRHLPLSRIARLLKRELRHGVVPLQVVVETAIASLDETTQAPVTVAEAIELYGLASHEVAELRALRVLSTQTRNGKEVFEGPDRDVLAALSSLKRLGFTQAAGFTSEDVATYRRAIEQLLAREVSAFARVAARGKPEEAIALARSAVDGATLLIIALRKKLVADLLNAMEPRRARRKERARAS